ncbi:MAG: FISUMP domain-containing protein, partial [Bacteroidota bacterium]
MFTTLSGCDSFVQLNLSVANSIAIQSVNSSNGFCPGGSVRIGLPAPMAGAIYRWKFNGNLIAGSQADTLLVNQAGDYVMEAQFSPTCTLVSNTLTIAVLNCNRVTGDLKYDNTNQTPLAGVPVLLKTLLGNVVMSDTTDSSGYYDMAGYANGNYLLDASVNYAWGGVTSADALLVTRAFNALVSLTPLRIKAGDVNANNISNSADALLINRRITGLLAAFSAGIFINNLPTVNALGNPIQANLRALSTGDVNGSYTVPSAAPTLVLDTVYGNGNVGTAVVRFTNPGAGVFERGVVWSTSPNPTVSSSKSVAGSGGFGFTHAFSLTNTTTIQYARAYARTSAGVYYSNERSFTPIPGLRCPGTPSVTDIDGNLYHTVQIGNQCWTQSNLKTSRYRNGDSLTYYPSSGNSTISQWSSTANGVFTNSWNPQYGHLYNGHGAIDSRGLCPTGWVIGNDSDWNILVQSLDSNFSPNAIIQSNIAGSKIKSVIGWNSPNIASNESGFSAFPAHYRYIDGSYHGANGSMSGFWTSTMGYIRSIGNDNGNVNRESLNLGFGYSIRCLQKQLPVAITDSVYQIRSTSARLNGRLTNDWGDVYTLKGFCYSNTPNPTVSNDTTMNGTGLGVYSRTLMNLIPSTTYYARAYATNSLGTSYGNEVSFTTDSLPGLRCPGTPSVTDIDGNVYYTVQIGNQCWTQSNLKVSTYRNGDNIPTALSNFQWDSTTSGANAIYNNDPVNDGLYGKLYNWYAVDDSRGLCPTGWHVPSDGEWTTLTDFLGGISVPGGAMKSTSTLPMVGGWNPPNTGATNTSGFTGLP